MGAAPVVTCAICGRSLLVGERPTRLSPDGREYVDVCPLCREQALELGWLREGSPRLPARPPYRRRRLLARLWRGAASAEPSLVDTDLDRLSPQAKALLEAAGLFNRSPHRRTVEGLMRSLGQPRVSLVLLSGANPEAVITIAWDISWYQYRVALDGSVPVQLAARGYDPDEIPSSFTSWNAEAGAEGTIVPDLAQT